MVKFAERWWKGSSEDLGICVAKSWVKKSRATKKRKCVVGSSFEEQFDQSDE